MSSTPGAVAASPYGFADEDAREYVITRPDTPAPWMNYLGAGAFGGIISNTGGGFSFDRDPRNRRVTRYRYNGIPADQPGRYVYLRDQETGEYWSPTWQPVRRDLDAYECRHGPAYTRITGELGGIECGILYFVPPDRDPDPACPCELWVMRVRNVGPSRRVLRAFSYVEFGLPDALTDQQNLDWGQQIVSSRYEDGAIRVGTKFSPTVSFFGSGRVPMGYTCDREEFVGRAGDLAAPIVVVRGEPSNSDSPRGNSIGSLCHEFELGPGDEADVTYVLGMTDHAAEIPGVVARYSDRAAVDAAFEQLRDGWSARLSSLTVATPDAEANAMLNTWNQVQCFATLSWSRFVSGCETGLARGMGTRDSAQDVLGVLHAAPDRALGMLTRVWRMQFRDGHAWHLFFPLTGEGSAGLAAEVPGWPQWFSDDHLWLVIATCSAMTETGDTGYLDLAVPWADGGEASVWEHLVRAVEFTLANRGPHGLPRSGFSDWDDTLNVDHGSGKAESVLAGMLFCRAVLDLAELSGHLGRSGEAVRFRRLHEEMAEALNGAAWDGGWYARSFDDDGRPIGAASELRHRVNMAPQAWSVIGEVAPADRAARALGAVDEALNTPLGIAMLAPPYDGFEDRVRGTSTYPPGAKENGGIFCHANAWMVVAAAMLGRGDDAYRYYRQVLPLARTDADRYVAEPYVYSQNVCGPTHPQFGMARNAWLTGTAAWMFVAATGWILGIRPTLGGLRIAPAIPGSWPGFRARRLFRGVMYDIEARRADRGGDHGREGTADAGARNGDAVVLLVDGQPIRGSVVPLPAPGITSVHVEVIIA